MNILYASNTLIPGRKASSVHIVKMCQAFARNGHKVLLSSTSPSATTSPGTVHEYYDVRSPFDFKAYPFFPRWGHQQAVNIALRTPLLIWRLLRFKPDLVYTRSQGDALLSLRMGIPTIFETHAHPGIILNTPEEKVYKRVISHPLLKRVVVITHALRELYLRHSLCPERLLFVAPDGADDHEEPAPPVDWPGRPGSFQAGYVGSLYPGRGIEIILSLARNIKDVDFHIIGGPETENKKIKQEAALPNLFLHGFQQPGKTAALRAACDVLLAPYQHEVGTSAGVDTSSIMSPIKVFEYMASRRPMIISDLPVLREVLDKDTAMLVPPDDTEGWSIALKTLRRDPALRNRLAYAASQKFKRSYTWQHRARNVLKDI